MNSIAVRAAADSIPDTREKLSIHGLSFFYGENKALHGIDLKLHERQVSALIGPSGCGKSSLLRILNRIYALYPNQRAEVEFLLDGENILRPVQVVNFLRAKVGMVFHK